MNGSTLSRETPSADAIDASVCLARLRQRMFAQVEVPRVAQYHLLRQIGAGGMGLVFAAWDPNLDRVVAIKVLRDGWGPTSGAHLRREALALARLRHPNVVSVFEVGDHDGQVYLAMEYVEGLTLREWSRTWRCSDRRDVRPVIDVFLQAAHGLAAAHAAGLVHRDVKPENMMIEADGRVRLMDFGLARNNGTDAARATYAGGSDGSSVTDHGGGVCGTPAYMAPEQFDGTTPGPSADQFALCACLFEVLYGRQLRPARLTAAAAVADVAPKIPEDRSVPRALRAILKRGLAIDPAARWPSMTALAEALARSRRTRRDQWVFTVSAVVAIAGIAGGWAVGSRDDARCSGSAMHLAGVWDDDRTRALESVIARANAAFAAQAWRALATELDRYRAEWIEAHRDACEAAQVRQEISVGQMDLRMACLRDRRRHLAALVDVVRQGHLEALAGAEEAVMLLPSIASCRDDDYVGRQGYDASDESSEHIGEMLARSAALRTSGSLELAREAATDVLAGAQEHGDPTMLARAHLALGLAQANLQESHEARESLVHAYELARRSRLPEVATDASIALVGLMGASLSRYEEAEWWSRIAALESVELDEPGQRAQLELAVANILSGIGRGDEAVTRAEAANVLLRNAGNETDRRFLAAQLQLGRLHLENGALERGSELIDDAARALEEILGPQHPSHARSQQLLLLSARLRGDISTAIRHGHRALALAESAVGPHHISLAPYLESLANTLSQAGATDEAQTVLERALALDRPRPLAGKALAQLYGRLGEILVEASPERSLAAFERAYEINRLAVGERHRDSVLLLVAKGAALGAVGRTQEAREAITMGLATGQAVLGMRHPAVGMIHHDLAREYERLDDHVNALHHNIAALDIVRASHGHDAYPLLAAHGNVCANLVHLERGAEALEHCQRALEISGKAVGDSTRVRADVHNNLGAALLLLDRLSEAKEAFRTAEEVWSATLGPRSFEASIALANLAEVAEREGDLATCAALYRDALSIRAARFGADHPSSTVPREGLARCEPRGRRGTAR